MSNAYTWMDDLAEKAKQNLSMLGSAVQNVATDPKSLLSLGQKAGSATPATKTVAPKPSF